MLTLVQRSHVVTQLKSVIAETELSKLKVSA